jgi:lipid A 3-O-deacylase
MSPKFRTILFTALLFFPVFSHQAVAQDLGQQMKDVSAKNPDDDFLTFSYENDMIGGGSDKFYTSGVQVNYFNINRKPSPVMHKIAQSWLGYDVGPTTATYYTLGQKIFTPSDITLSEPQFNDRPWAGWLYGTVGLVNAYQDHVDQFGMTLGVIGPPSLAEETQKFIHQNITSSPEPEGWDNQLHTEAGFILSWDRRWLQTWTEDLGTYRLQFEPNVSGAIGNINTYGGVGGTLTFGPHQKLLQDTPPRLSPAMPGTGYFTVPKDRNWDWYLFTGLNGRVVLRDIFLDGNTFRDSASVDKKYLVADANAGLALTYGATRVAYTLVYRTREFDGQDDPSVFGSLSLTHSF